MSKLRNLVGELRNLVDRHRRTFVSVVSAAVAIAGIVLVLTWIGGASELSTLALFCSLGILILLSGFLVSLVLVFMGADASNPGSPVRHAATGLGLLFIGTMLALSLLPESHTGSVAGAIGFLPPAKARSGFTLGVLARPHGCSNSVPVKFVVEGSNRYWEGPYWAVKSRRYASSPFVLVLPGSYSHLLVGLGPMSSEALAVPVQAEMVESPNRKGKHRSYEVDYEVAGPDRTHRDVTVITGHVHRWPVTRRALIVEAEARWITHRGIGNCNLELPALAGAASATALVQALTCPQLNTRFAPNSCATPPVNAASTPGFVSLAPWLETARGEAVVRGSNVSPEESDPQPSVIRGSPEWTCVSGASSVQVSLEVAPNVESGGDCHAVVAVVAFPWHRDLILVLLGAFVAVGVHMLFQGMIAGVRARAHERSSQTGPSSENPG
jgi:hypothetical protein